MRILTAGGPQTMISNPEVAAYEVVCQANTPDARKLCRWIFGTVLPSIRQENTR
jgi:prophage antirepressor-like protein